MTLKIDEPTSTTLVFRGRCQDTGHTLEVMTDRFQSDQAEKLSKWSSVATVPCKDLLGEEDQNAPIEARFLDAIEQRLRIIEQIDTLYHSMIDETKEELQTTGAADERAALHEGVKGLRKNAPTLPLVDDFIAHEYDVEGYTRYLEALDEMEPLVQDYVEDVDYYVAFRERHIKEVEAIRASLEARFNESLKRLVDEDDYDDVPARMVEEALRKGGIEPRYAEDLRRSLGSLPSVRSDMDRRRGDAWHRQEAATWVSHFGSSRLLQGAKEGYSMLRAYREERIVAVDAAIRQEAGTASLKEEVYDIEDSIESDEKASPSEAALQLLSAVKRVLSSESPHIDRDRDPEAWIVFSRDLLQHLGGVDAERGVEAVLVRDPFRGAPDLFLVPAGGHIE